MCYSLRSGPVELYELVNVQYLTKFNMTKEIKWLYIVTTEVALFDTLNINKALRSIKYLQNAT